MDTPTLTLTEFLLARIAEDEAVARKADYSIEPMPALFAVPMSDGSPSGISGHALMIKPTRVLAECEAKRQVIGWHEHDGDHCLTCNWTSRYGGCPTLRALALAYANHPDYREEWRP